MKNLIVVIGMLLMVSFVAVDAVPTASARGFRPVRAIGRMVANTGQRIRARRSRRFTRVNRLRVFRACR